MEKTSLYFKEGSSDKEYHVSLDGGTVTVQYGRRGNALTSLPKCKDINPAEAKKIYDKVVKGQLAKGYHIGEEGVEYSAPVNPDYTGYQPQLLNEIDESTALSLLSNDSWLMQEKEDGRNIGVILSNGKAVASNKKGIAISIPEKVIKDIEGTFNDNLTFCGELVGDVFKVWDILDDCTELDKVPYINRYITLRALVSRINSNDIRTTRTAISSEEKIALWNEMKEKNAEGVVFKRKMSIYHPGRPASGGDQLKYKFTATCSVIAGVQSLGKRSVAMWLLDGFDKDSSIYVGSVTVYPNQEIPKEGSVIEVKYLYAYKGGSLFQPVLIGPRDDVDANECTISQLKYKREIDEDEV